MGKARQGGASDATNSAKRISSQEEYFTCLISSGSCNGGAECTATELSDIMNQLVDRLGPMAKSTPSKVGKSLSGLFKGSDVAEISGIRIERRKRRVKKKCGDGGSQLQTVYTFSNNGPSAQKKPQANHVLDKGSHPIFKYDWLPIDQIDLNPYFFVKYRYRNEQWAGVAIVHDPETNEPISKFYYDLYSGHGASVDRLDTLGTFEFAVQALNSSPHVEYIGCLAKPADDLLDIKMINSMLCQIDVPVISKPTYHDVYEADESNSIFGFDWITTD